MASETVPEDQVVHSAFLLVQRVWDMLRHEKTEEAKAFRGAVVICLAPLLKASHIPAPLHSLSSALTRPNPHRYAGLSEDVYRLLRSLVWSPEVVYHVRDTLLLHNIHTELVSICQNIGSPSALKQVLQSPSFLQYVTDTVHVRLVRV